MKNPCLILCLIPFMIMCSSNQNKFIELKDAMNILEKNDTSTQDMYYSLSSCHLLRRYDSLYAYLEQYDTLHTDHKEIILTKKYKNIETLITNLDENLIDYIKDTFGIETEIDFPVLKYKNRVFVNIFYLDFSCSFIIELKETQKATITLIYICNNSPATHWEIYENKI
jgi:hypothetical protein